MTPFERIEAVAAPLAMENIDTDKILAGRFLKTISRRGLGSALFSSLREDPDFVLNRPPWDGAGILIALDNFGCGSSREHAPWALLDFGIRCIIAPSIADIFYNNCFKNGILPVVLPSDDVAMLMALAADPARCIMRVDLVEQSVEAAGHRFVFSVDPRRKQDLLAGTDEIERTLGYDEAITAFELRRNVRSASAMSPISESAG